MDAETLSRLQLKRPCKNCPFSVAPTRIRFACRERAAEIEEIAYRQGFPCHLSAEEVEEVIDGEEETFFGFGEGTQHCVGSILLRLNEGDDCWPALDNEELPDDYLEKVEPFQAEAFASVEDFLEANEATR
jgi:hypothetical protein